LIDAALATAEEGKNHPVRLKYARLVRISIDILIDAKLDPPKK
jgi:hypothetical protein